MRMEELTFLEKGKGFKKVQEFFIVNPFPVTLVLRSLPISPLAMNVTRFFDIF